MPDYFRCDFAHTTCPSVGCAAAELTVKLQEEKVVAHLLAGASFGELALMQVATHIQPACKAQIDVRGITAGKCLGAQGSTHLCV